MSEEFINKNKEAILEEISQSLTSLNSYINEILTSDINPETDGLYMRTMTMAISHQLGYLTAIFNQYFVLEAGYIPKQKPIGFGILTQKGDL